MNLFAGIDKDPGLAREALLDLHTFGAVKLAAGGATVLVVSDAQAKRLFVGMEKAGVWLSAGTPANKFELVKGGFRFDIAEALMAVLQALGMSKLDDAETASSKVPRLSGPENQED